MNWVVSMSSVADQAIVELDGGIKRGNDYVLSFLILAGLAVVAWQVVRILARRGVSRAVRWYRVLDPRAQATSRWILSAPATFAYVSAWTATTMLVQGAPRDLVEQFTVYSSSNIAGLLLDPIRALAVSSLLVSDRGAGWIAYVVVFALVVVRVEQRFGTGRTVLLWVISHVGGSLLVVAAELIGIEFGLVKNGISISPDVGVSYVMVGSLGAYFWLVTRRGRWWYLAGLVLATVLPLAILQSVWDVGHFVVMLIGLATGWLMLRRTPPRPRVRWRQLTSVPPRPLHPAAAG